MTNEIHLAFAHPVERSAASGNPDLPIDRISVRDLVLSADIGAFQLERGAEQRLRFNIAVEVVPAVGVIDDDVDRILSYDKVTEAVEGELEAERFNLLETLAERIALRILAEPQAQRVFVRIEKLDRGPGALGVEIVRARGQVPAEAAPVQESVPHPRVVYLDNAAVANPDLGTAIDRWSRDGEPPLILCVGYPDQAQPQTGQALAQRRIDLLAVEQNAWVLAGNDRRCIVVGTRTELDWAMRHGQISVWAPSKMVLDAAHSPSASPRDATALAAWFASEMEAEELVVVGAELPASDVPLRGNDLSAP